MTTFVVVAILTIAQAPDVERARNWAACLGPTPVEVVAACTRLIDAGLSKDDEANALEKRGVARGRLKAFAEALADFDRALAVGGDRPYALNMRAGVYMSLRQFDKAIPDLKRAAEIDPDNPSHPRGLASALLATGDNRAAIAAASRAIELLPTYAPAWAMRGTAKAALKDAKGALEDLDRAIEMDPRVPTFLLDRGRVKSDSGDYFGAMQDFERAIALNPTTVLGYHDRGIVKLRMKDYQGAIADFEKTIALNPTHYLALASLSDARAAMGDLEGAVRECAFDRMKATGSGAVYRVCGANYGRAGRIDDAMAAYSAAIELEPKNGASYHFRGLFKSDRHDFSGALADFRTALGLDASRDYTILRIFLLESRLGARAAARVALKEAIARRTSETGSTWVLTIAGYLAGTVTEADLLKAADSGAGAQIQDRRCEAYFYSGWMHLIDGDTAGARTRFEQSVATGSPTMLELRSAKAELEFMQKK